MELKLLYIYFLLKEKSAFLLVFSQIVLHNKFTWQLQFNILALKNKHWKINTDIDNKRFIFCAVLNKFCQIGRFLNRTTFKFLKCEFYSRTAFLNKIVMIKHVQPIDYFNHISTKGYLKPPWMYLRW